MPEVPRVDAPIRTITPEIPGQPINRGSSKGEVLQILGGASQQVFDTFTKANILSETTKAENEYSRRIYDIHSRAESDNELTADKINSYDREIAQAQEDSAKLISIPQVRDNFQLQYQSKSDIARAKIQGVFNKKIIDLAKVHLDQFVKDRENDFLKAGNPREKEMVVAERNDKIRQMVDAGFLDKADAQKQIYDLDNNWAKSQVEYDLMANPFITKELLKQNAYPNLGEIEKSKAIEKADKEIKARSKDAEDEIYSKFIDGSLTMEDVENASVPIDQGGIGPKKALAIKNKLIASQNRELKDIKNDSEAATKYIDMIDLMVSDSVDNFQAKQILVDAYADGVVDNEESKRIDAIKKNLEDQKFNKSTGPLINGFKTIKSWFHQNNPSNTELASAFKTLINSASNNEDVSDATESILRNAYNNTYPEQPLDSKEKVNDPSREKQIVYTPMLEKLAKGYAMGISGTVRGIGGALESSGKTGNVLYFSPALSLKLGGKTVAEHIGEKISAYGKEMQDFYEIPDQDFTYNIASGFGSMSTFFIPGLGIARGVQAVTAFPRIATWLGVSASAVLEASVEGGSTYQRGVEKGMNPKQAADAGSHVFWTNIPLVAITNKFGIFGESGGAVAKFIKSAGNEGFQEFSQQIVSNIAVNDPALKGAMENAVIGTIVGGGVGLSVNATSALKEIAESKDLKDRLSSIKSPSEKLKSEKGQLGFSKEETEAGVPLKSNLLAVVENKLPNIVSGEQALKTLNNAGLSQEEIEFSGVKEFLASKEKFSRNEINEFVKKNKIQVETVVRSDSEQSMKLNELEKNLNKVSPSYDYVVSQLGENTPYISGQPPRWFYKKDGVPTEVPENYHEALDKYADAEAELTDYRNDLEDENFTPAETKFGQYTLPGGENYKEVLITMPKKEKFNPEDVEIVRNRQSVTQGTVDLFYKGQKIASYGDNGPIEKNYQNYTDDELKKVAQRVYEGGDKINGIPAKSVGAFTSSHFDEPNILVHLRTTDRITPDGKKILFVEEIQSDWHSKGKKEGYTSEQSKEPNVREDENVWVVTFPDKGFFVDVAKSKAKNSEEALKYAKDNFSSMYQFQTTAKGVPNAPFKNTWHELALKQAIDIAVKQGYDGVAFINGEQTADRYNLAKYVDAVGYNKNTKTLMAFKEGQNTPIIHKIVQEDELENYIGKDVTKKLLEQKANSEGQVSVRGNDLKIGGEWAKKFYDEILPKSAEKYIKKWGSKIENINVGVVGKNEIRIGAPGSSARMKQEQSNQKGFFITPTMKKEVSTVGQPLFGSRLAGNPLSNERGTAGTESSQPLPEGVGKKPEIFNELEQQVNNPKAIEKLKKKVEEFKSTQEQRDYAKQTLDEVNNIRKELTGRIKKYEGGYLSEELAAIPKVYITKDPLGSTPDEIMQELRDRGIDINSESELAQYLNDLEDTKKSLEADIESKKPEMVRMREATLAKEKLKSATSTAKEAQRQMEKTLKEQEKEIARTEKKSFREGRKAEAELRKKRYFGENITPEQRKELYVVALNKGVIYTDYSGKTHDKLHGIIRYYKGASFDELKNYISNLSGEKGNPPKLFKLYGDINKDAEAMKVINEERKNWQDITPAEVYTLDPARIVEKVSRQPLYESNSLADNTFNIIASADEAMFDRKIKELADLDANRQGIHANSKESAELMQKFESGEPLTDKEQKVADFLRSKYDMWIREANDMRDLLGKKPIPYRQNYMTHIVETNLLHDFFLGDEQAMGKISNEQMDAIRKGDYTKGNMPFNKFAQKRLGDKTKFDAIGNYVKYMNVLAKEIYYTPALSHSRKFIEYALMEQPNAFKTIDRMLNDLKGKKSIVDQNLIGWVASSKPIQWLRTHIARSALVGNINFWAMNTSNFVTSYPELGNWLNYGMAKFVGNKETREFAFKNSKMLKGRQIDPDFVDQPIPTKLEEAVAAITNLIEYNNIGATFIGAYHKGIEELGFTKEKAIEYADSIARKTQVGYKPYEVNAWMRSNAGKLFSQFQNWSFNAMNYILYDVGASNIPSDLKSILSDNKTNRTRWGTLISLIAVSIAADQVYKLFGLRQPYTATGIIPSVAGMNIGKYGDIGPVRIMKDIGSSITSKKQETRNKAMQRVAGSVVPGGTQAVRLMQGKVFPGDEKHKKRSGY